MKNKIQALEKKIKSLTEIINILSEELKYNTTEEVKNADCMYADKFKSKNMISGNCDQIKPQLPVAQKELFSSVKTITDTIREELKCMKQTTYKNLSPAISCSSFKSSNSMASSIPNPTYSKTRAADYSQYSIPTANRFDILSNYQELQHNEPECSPDLQCPPRSLPKTSNIQHSSLYLKKLPQKNATTTPSHYPFDNHILQKIVNNEDSLSFIPTIVNGVTSTTTNQETAQEASEVSSDVNGDMIHSVITNLRKSISAHQNRKHSYKKHRIILIGDSNMRGYVSSLEPLLNSNYNLYSIVKPGSGTNELEKTANEAISHLTHHDMIILCYGTNEFDQQNLKNPKKKFSCTFQNIKNFIRNNHTNILLMNIPYRYDIPNALYVNKIISRLNRKLQK
jgi:hypothetical protein